VFPGYGCTLYVGLGIPIPILDADLAWRTAVSDEDISTTIFDYGVPSRTRPAFRTVTYAELRSGRVCLEGKSVPTVPLSSLSLARKVADELKRWIEAGSFSLTAPVQTLPRRAVVRPLVLRPAEKGAAENKI